MNCPSCGTENPADAHFCGECGTPLPAAAAPPPPPQPPAPPEPPTERVPAAAPTEPVPVTPVPPAAPVEGAGAAPPPPPMPPPTTFAAPPPAGGEPPKKSKKGLVLGLVALLVVAAAVGSFLVLGGDDDGGADQSIVLEPIGLTLRDDFAGNLDLDTPGGSIAVALGDVPPLGSSVAAAMAGRTADGDEPGLYGGSRDVAVCDVEQLVEFLTDDDNAAKAEAWAEVQGIDVDEIEEFVADLTPVRLRFDTRVTNHGFRDGEATPSQSILERGTAVLVDDRGVPRVKCNCGNPLAEPAELGDVDEDEALDEAQLQNPDDAWDDFDPDEVVVVDAGDTVEAFTLVDLDTGELFERPVGTNGDADTDVGDVDAVCEVLGDSPTCGATPPDDGDGDETTTTTEGDGDTTTTTIELGTGDVQVTLEWGSAADLDLSVTDPTGEQVDFVNRGPSATGGQLDVDSNVGCDEDGSVENIFWPPGGAPAGTYTVTVTGFTVESCSQGAQSGDYTLTIRVAGQPEQVIQDSVGEDAPDSFEFQV